MSDGRRTLSEVEQDIARVDGFIEEHYASIRELQDQKHTLYEEQTDILANRP